MVSGMKELFWPSFPQQTGRQVLSTLFNQVSIKAERDLVLLYSGGSARAYSKVTDTAASHPSDLHPDGEQEWRGK